MPDMSPVAQVLARRVLRHETGGRAEPAALAEAAERADARLRERLASLIGQTGYTTLLVARAVRLAQADALLTRDQRKYAVYFPTLVLRSPTQTECCAMAEHLCIGRS